MQSAEEGQTRNSHYAKMASKDGSGMKADKESLSIDSRRTRRAVVLAAYTGAAAIYCFASCVLGWILGVFSYGYFGWIGTGIASVGILLLGIYVWKACTDINLFE
ncbi:hypothetical protein GCM10011396_36750 [Undibacterium terreum]|uniref:Uncharacterized protein n=1 Tax=Undibacterium terreum TaxID=1224302 RepID=A0A916XNL8_9BURK|nr:hypothetical protein GCM10011396_36750 [Undibacterium terreum]